MYFIKNKTITSEPITVQDVQTHLRVDGEDAYLLQLISLARRVIEDRTNRALATQNIVAYANYESNIEVLKPPCASISKVSFILADGSESETTSFIVNTDVEPAILQIDESAETLRDVANVKIEYAAGYGPGALPEPLRFAMLLLTGHFYENRESTSERKVYEVPFAVEALIGEYIVYEMKVT